MMTPWASTVNKKYMSNTEINPITVAVPTSFLRLARLEKTTAPSIPMNTHTVTSIVLFT